jgi:hypothetical protein
MLTDWIVLLCMLLWGGLGITGWARVLPKTMRGAFDYFMIGPCMLAGPFVWLGIWWDGL